MRARLDKASSLLSKDVKYAPFTSTRLGAGEIQITTEGMACPTMATDGVSIYAHPDYANEAPIEDIRLTIAHETLHIALFHCDGRIPMMISELEAQGFDKKSAHQLCNMGYDHAVNNMLADMGEKIPADWLCDRKYQGWSGEEVTRDLAKQAKTQPPRKDPTGGKSRSGNGGGHEKMNDASPQQQAKAREAAEQAVANGTIMDAIKASSDIDLDSAEGRGNTYMAEALERARANRQAYVDWRLELADFCGSARTDERTSTYSRICRRPVPGLIRPGKKREGKPHVGVILDTSGSMYMALPKLMVELEAMSQDGFSFTCLCSDGGVYGPFEFAAGEFDYRDLPLQGGGGSDMRPVFEKAMEFECDAMVFCTDGDIEWPSQERLSQLPPCLLVECDRAKKSEVSGFFKHLIMR